MAVFIVHEDGHREWAEFADAIVGIGSLGSSLTLAGFCVYIYMRIYVCQGRSRRKGTYNWRHMPQGEAGVRWGALEFFFLGDFGSYRKEKQEDEDRDIKVDRGGMR